MLNRLYESATVFSSPLKKSCEFDVNAPASLKLFCIHQQQRNCASQSGRFHVQREFYKLKA